MARHLLIKDAQALGAERPERTANCLRNRISKSAPVDIQYSPNEERARYGNLQTCGSVWACPVCAMRISEQRREELSAAIIRWRKKGGTVAMLTLTIRHSSFDVLTQMLDRMLGNSKKQIQGAMRRFKSGRAWKKIAEDYGIAGDIKATETTHGKNGWHPHLHIVLFIEPDKSDFDPDQLERDIAVQWIKALRLEGLTALLDFGADVTVDNRQIAKYMTKWGIEHEVTKWVVKEPGKGQRSPMDLLRDYGLGDEHAGRLWLEYSKAFKGRSQLQYSRGLKSLLGIGEVSDQDAAEDVKPDDEILMSLNDLQWWTIKKHHVRGEVLRAAEKGGIEAVTELIEGLHESPTSPSRQAGQPYKLTTFDIETGEMKVRIVKPTDSDYDYLVWQAKHNKNGIIPKHNKNGIIPRPKERRK